MSISYSKLFVGISLPALCTGLASLLLSISANAQTIRPTTQKELKVFDPTTGNSGNIGIRAAAGTLSYTLTLPAAAPSANQVLTANAVTGGNVTLTWATPVSGTVTSVGTNTSTGITGGTITNAGTLAIDTFRIATRAWRQKGIDSVQSNLTSGLALKVNISDTASMLTPYLRKIDTTAMLSPYLRANVAAATYVPQSRTITINGTSQGLTADRTFSVGTVTSVATNIGTGITGGTFTNTGTIAADTLLLSTRAWRQKGIDSVAALANTKVSSVSGTTPISSSGGTSPTISISQASVSSNGFLTSSDWTTFSNKQNTISLTTNETSGAATLSGTTLNIPQYQAALTNPVTGTGTQNYLSKFATAGTLTNSLLFDNGTNVGIGTTSVPNILTVGSSENSTNTLPALRVQGQSLSDVAGRFLGSYGSLILNANSTYSASARRFMLTSALNLNSFAIIRSENNNSDPSLGVAGALASGSADFVIDNTGEVGIGTQAPTARLQVMGNNVTTSNTLIVQDGSSNNLLTIRNDGYSLFGPNTTSTQVPVARFITQKFGVNNGLQLYAGGTLSTTFGDYIAIYLQEDNKSAIQAGDNNAGRDLLLNPAGGNVGIGTTSPDHKLDIEDNVNSSLITRVRNLNSLGSAASTLRLGNNDFENLLDISGWSSGFTENAVRKRNGVSLEANGAGGLSISAGTLSGVIRLFTGGQAASNQRLTILSDGRVGIGETNPLGRLEVRASSEDTEVLEIENENQEILFRVSKTGVVRIPKLNNGANSALRINSDGSLTLNTSDARLKKNLQVIPNALQKVMSLRGVTYNWKDGRDTTRVLGMIAQEMLKVAPELVFQNNNGYYGIHYAETTGLLVEAIKEQQKIIDQLKTEQAATGALIRQLQLDLQAIRKLNTAPKD